MKKKIVTLITAFVLIANLLFANAGKIQIPESVISEFGKTFSNAKEVRWEDFGNYFKATFLQTGKTWYAFYSDNAEFMGVAKNLLSDKLPDLLQTEIKTKFQGYWITDLAGFHVGDKAGFIVTLENTDQKIVLTAGNNKHWQIHSRENKA